MVWGKELHLAPQSTRSINAEPISQPDSVWTEKCLKSLPQGQRERMDGHRKHFRLPSCLTLSSRVYGRLLGPAGTHLDCMCVQRSEYIHSHGWLFLFLLLCTAAYLNNNFPSKSSCSATKTFKWQKYFNNFTIRL